MPEGFVQRGGFWVVGQFVLMLCILILGIGCPNERHHMWLGFFGVFLLIIAAACGLAGSLALGRNLTPFPKPQVGAGFVTHGIYNLMRHPLYTAVLSAAMGWSLTRQSWIALAASALLGLFLDAKARREEHWLRQQFPGYAQYQRSVRRFIPWLY